MKRNISLFIGLCIFSLQTLSAESVVNALWTDTHGFGIWLFGRAVSCETFDPHKSPYLVFGTGAKKRTEVADRTFDVSKLDPCIVGLANDVALCASGSIELKFFPASNEYIGKYHIKLTNGAIWQGDFRARRCE